MDTSRPLPTLPNTLCETTTMQTSTETTTQTATVHTRSLTIGGVTFDGDEIDEYVWEASTRTAKASNSACHRMGKPNWWARIGDKFVKLDRVRCDQECPDIDLHDVIAAIGNSQAANVEMVIGYGKAGYTEARRWTFDVRYIRERGNPGS